MVVRGTGVTPRWYKGLRARIVRSGLLWTLNALFLIFFLFPFYWQTVTALKPPAEVDALPVRWLPSHLYWGNVRAVLTDPPFMRAVLNSAIVATTTTAVALLVGSSAAYALAHLPLPRTRGLLMGIVSAATIPPIALVPSLYLLFRQLQWLDTYAALVVGDLAVALPFAIWVLSNVFRAIPADLIEQAEADGCTPGQALWHVVVPLAAPGLAAAGILIFITVWNELLFALTFTLHAQMATVPVALGTAGGWGGTLAAASEVVTAPIIVLTLVGQRGIVRGLMSGAVK